MCLVTVHCYTGCNTAKTAIVNRRRTRALSAAGTMCECRCAHGEKATRWHVRPRATRARITCPHSGGLPWVSKGGSVWEPRKSIPPSAETAMDCALTTLTEHAEPAGPASVDKADS